jgi:hypothetical protein
MRIYPAHQHLPTKDKRTVTYQEQTNIPLVGAAAPVAVSLGPAVSTLCEILLAADASAEEKALDATD